MNKLNKQNTLNDDIDISNKFKVLLDIRSSLYFQPPTTTNNSKSIKTLTINPIGI